MDTIYLIGFMGVGKTTIGQSLSNKTGYSIIDLDEEVEKKSGMKISELFSEYGEVCFRNYEFNELTTQVKQELVVSTGGGIITYEKSRLWLSKQKNVIYLQATMSTIFERIKLDIKNNRPLASGKNYDELTALLNKRVPLYEEAATFNIKVDKKTPEQVSDEILYLLKG